MDFYRIFDVISPKVKLKLAASGLLSPAQKKISYLSLLFGSSKFSLQYNHWNFCSHLTQLAWQTALLLTLDILKSSGADANSKILEQIAALTLSLVILKFQ